MDLCLMMSLVASLIAHVLNVLGAIERQGPCCWELCRALLCGEVTGQSEMSSLPTLVYASSQTALLYS